MGLPDGWRALDSGSPAVSLRTLFYYPATDSNASAAAGVVFHSCTLETECVGVDFVEELEFSALVGKRGELLASHFECELVLTLFTPVCDGDYRPELVFPDFFSSFPEVD